ncbi:hypothetical protein [Candidatus Sororendozoicomonas aggregata]|uniref:hypothetical protein n=1 Tax=Candidatus Sororendozoicomonas aggregata TaxID=3073239 RepID=UPI002ED50F64
MKKYILYLSLPALMLWAASNVYAASTCQGDVNAMRKAIDSSRYHWLTTENGILISKVLGTVISRDPEVCGSLGVGRGFSEKNLHQYDLSWKRGNWEDTLVASSNSGLFSDNTDK